ncbi:MAG: hypothetical protein JXB47_11590 [Anaerolineae bacterium]|nr:hypothetical protein [Anaerolineae bacterium]
MNKRQAVADAIWALHAMVRWAPGEDITNLEACKASGRLHPGATLTDQLTMIEDEIVVDDNLVFYYHDASEPRGVIVFRRAGRDWIIRFTLDGVIETARPLLEVPAYLAQSQLERLGTVGELLD